MIREFSMWVSIGLIAIISIALFKIVAGKVGNRVPVLADIAGFI